MKKLSFLILTLLLSSTYSFSQMYAGVKGGILFSKFIDGNLTLTDLGNNWYKMYNEIGGTFGLAGEYKFNDYFSFAPELTFARKGALIEILEDTIVKRTDVYHISYLEVPLLLKGNYNLDFMEFYLKTGPNLGFIVGGYGTEYGTVVIGKNVLKLENFFAIRDQDYSKFDFGWYFGTGMSFFIGPGKLILGCHYDLGFIKVADDRKTQPYDYKNMGKNRAFVIETGYLYEF